MRIAIVGTGYVGLVVGTGFAENGHSVVCVDHDPGRIEPLSRAKLPIYEPGLEELVVRNIEEERLRFTTDIGEAVKDCLLAFICVGTPADAEGRADLAQVMDAARGIAGHMTGYRIIVNKSTCPVGTTEQIRDQVAQITKQPFDVVVNPEFLKEGAAVDDFMRPDRVVVGADDVRVIEIMRELYAPFLRTGKPFLTMDIRSAEMTKYVVNIMLAARISMMNELANICGACGADMSKVREGIIADSRLGSTYLFPGLGFGGSCLPKDVLACAQVARQNGIPSRMLDAVTEVNEAQWRDFADRIIGYYGDGVAGKKLAVWGAAFKPRTDDIRNAPALKIVDALLEAGASISLYDPVAAGKVREQYGDRVSVPAKSYTALENADGLIIATEWREFHYPDLERMAELMRERVIFDGRNLFNPKLLEQHGFHYISVGRPCV